MFVPSSRVDQFTFLLGYISRLKKTRLALNEAMLEIENIWKIKPPYKSVFEVCPNNYKFEDHLSNFHRVERGITKEISNQLFWIIEDFLFLKSDFFPPCCGDAFTEYCTNEDNGIILVCDRCETQYDLNEKVIEQSSFRKMLTNDFHRILDSESSNIWPYHKKVRDLLRKSMT